MEGEERNGLKRLFQSLGRQLIQDVPADLEACMFCRTTECSQDKWIVCDKRIAHAKCLEAHQGNEQL